MNAALPIQRPARLRDYDLPREIFTGFRFQLDKNILSHGVNATPGAYFVTVCCQKRNPYFEFKPAKSMIESVWRDIPNQFANAGIDVFVVMPDHFHGIIIMKPNDNETVGERPRALPSRESSKGAGSTNGKAQGPSPTKFGSVIDVVQWFKSLTTAKYRHGVKSENWPPYFKKLWQRSFYDHVIPVR